MKAVKKTIPAYVWILAFVIVALVMLQVFFMLVPQAAPVNKTPEEIAKESNSVKAFLQKHPVSETMLLNFKQQDWNKAVREIEKDCNKIAGSSEYYRVRFFDENSGNYITAWVNWSTKALVCVSKIGKKAENVSDEEFKQSSGGSEVQGQENNGGSELTGDENQGQGSNGGQGNGTDGSQQGIQTCTEGLKCRDLTHKAFQNKDCSWKDESICEFGCETGVCKAKDLCAGKTCGSYCDGNVGNFNGKCTNGTCFFSKTACPNGCENGVCKGNEKCAGISCPDKCEGNALQRGSCVDGNCVYQTIETCGKGCFAGKCVTAACTDSSECRSYCTNLPFDNVRYYLGYCDNGSCNYMGAERCKTTCVDLNYGPQGNFACDAESCSNNQCPIKCSADGSQRLYLGTCRPSGFCEYTKQNCDFGCENAACKFDPCETTKCPDVCENSTTLKFYARCSNGQCNYPYSRTCPFGCSNGACNSDPCNAMTCSNYCSGSTLYTKTGCSNGQCQYSSSNCPYGCQNGKCVEYNCQFSWPQKVTDQAGTNILWQCGLGARSYCKQGTPQCCKYADLPTGHYDCVDCRTAGNCTESSCIGVSCPKTCRGNIKLYSGYCAAGQCNYSEEVCPFGCTNGTCNPDPCIGVSCPNKCNEKLRDAGGSCSGGVCNYTLFSVCSYTCQNGECTSEVGLIFTTKNNFSLNLGGLSGADALCANAASSAKLAGTWIALLSTSTVNAKDRLPDVVFKNMIGEIVANSKADLFDGSIGAKLSYNEYGDQSSWIDYISPNETATGTNPDGTLAVNIGKPCGDWTLAVGFLGVANPYSTDGQWLKSGTGLCDLPRRLYCVRIS